MAIKNYSKKIIFWVLVVTIASCSKYERTNPNDISGPNGTPILSIDGFEVISDNNGDAKIQKNETATLKVLVKNTGSKIAQISSAVFTSNSAKLVVENFTPENDMIGYVGKVSSLGNLRIKVSSNASVGETLSCKAKLTDKTGNVFNTTLTVIVSELKPSVLSISTANLMGYNEADNSEYGNYSKGLTPMLSLIMENKGTETYYGDLKFTITSLNSAYPYLFTETIVDEIAPGSQPDYQIKLDCLPQNLPNNTNLLLNIAVADNQGGTVEKQINVLVKSNIAKLDFTSFDIWRGSQTPGSTIYIDCTLLNSGGRALSFSQSGAKISTTSSYLNSLSINVIDGKIDQNESNNTLVSFSAAIASNCPVGTKIPVTIELTTNESCPTKFTSVVQLVVE